MLVEDDPAIIDIYVTSMTGAHFDVDSVTLGQVAITKIKNIVAKEEQKPDIILLDLILPDINGMEVLKEVRSNDATKDIAVFILSNQAKEELQNLGGAKPDKFIIKANTTPTELLEMIKGYLNDRT